MPTSEWKKSSRSGNTGGDCVELRSTAGGFQVRDSKLGEGSPILDLSGSDLTGLLRSTKA
ncbi:DUF397 domain-containing protein [Glycomyces tarimensis]